MSMADEEYLDELCREHERPSVRIKYRRMHKFFRRVDVMLPRPALDAALRRHGLVTPTRETPTRETPRAVDAHELSIAAAADALAADLRGLGPWAKPFADRAAAIASAARSLNDQLHAEASCNE